MSGDTYNQPAQPSYGEGMADALKAQVQLLTGTGDFAETGSLESLLPLEESIRRKTAQADTDILRETLLGGSTTSRVVKDPKTGKYGMPDGEVVTSISGSSGSKYQVMGGGSARGYGILDTSTGGVIDGIEMYKKLGFIEDTGTEGAWDRENDGGGKLVGPLYKITQKGADAGIELDASGRFGTPNVARITKAGETGIIMLDAGLYHQSGIKKGLTSEQTSEVYRQLVNSTDKEIEQTFNFTNPNTGKPLEQGETITTRTGDGMVDLLGDTRNVQEFETRNATQADVDAGLATEIDQQIVSQKDTIRQAGFDDNKNFLGLSAMAEDIQRGNLSRQREADLQDVARLEPLFGQIMEDYKPGTSSAISGAKDLIEEQKDNLLGKDVGISDPNKIQSQGVGATALRQGLMTDAQTALGQGLTDREERQIGEAARARSTMMGRTFDQSGAIAEAGARVAEDNQRKMQNRGFAQSVLGQEAGMQTSDDARNMQAGQFNVASQMDAEKLRESLRQQGLLGYLDAASRLSQLEDQGQLDPFQAILGRTGGGSLQAGQSVFGQAGYGLNSQPSYLNPESGLGYIQNQATNAASMYNANVSADATKTAGLYSGIGSAAGGLAGGIGAAGGAAAFFCWVAREVYGEHNPAWLLFRSWMLNDSPSLFRKAYIKYGERFANFISDKPRLKARIRSWMDSKIGR